MNNWRNITKEEPPENTMLLLKTNEMVTLNHVNLGAGLYASLPQKATVNVVMVGLKYKTHYYVHIYSYENGLYRWIYNIYADTEKYQIIQWKYYDDNNIKHNVNINNNVNNYKKCLDID